MVPIEVPQTPARARNERVRTVGWGDAAEVAVAEPVAVAFEGYDVGVVDEPVDHGGDDVVTEYLSPQRPSCWLEVTIRLACSSEREIGASSRDLTGCC